MGRGARAQRQLSRPVAARVAVPQLSVAGAPVVRRCTRCELTKPLTEFNFKYPARGIYQSHCRTCQQEWRVGYYATHGVQVRAKVQARRVVVRSAVKDSVVTYLRAHPCVDCGEADPIVLQFDHRHSKKYEVAAIIRGAYIWETVQAEIAKCEVRCANCHARRTSKEQKWYGQQLAAQARPTVALAAAA